MRSAYRRDFLKTAAGALCAPALAAADGAGRAAAGKPNIIFIVVDDLGYGELGCQGNQEVPTPHIDSIARRGVRFTDGYVSAPVCSPSRAGFMTGRYQTRFGHELNAIGAQNRLPDIGLPLEEATLGSLLKTAGYYTGAFGKWHLGGTAPYHPLERGFDEFFGFLHEGHYYVPPPYAGVTAHLRANEPPYDADNPILRGVAPVEEAEYLTQAFTREALSFIDRRKESPFFLYLPYNAIHSPMQAAARDFRRFGHIQDPHRRVFAAMLSAFDDGIGAILSLLRRDKLEEKTLIFFLSDNGGPTEELTSSNKPLRGGKGQLWEGGIRVPFLMQWKGHVPAGKVYSEPVISLDVLPTALAAAGAKPREGRAPDGVNLLPFLTGAPGKPPHEQLFWRYGASLALRRGKWKLVKQAERGAPAASFRLFDLSADIAETTDLAAANPAVVAEMRGELDRLNARMVPARWGGNRPAQKAKV